ncbi:hypothetical protein [Teredinibacter purpureus]|uniref:hypothetical protein n=1 Tax=Teredinibacter purpureus TaxID=2731756 RepID=UPI0005F805BF|nr:hypothetical protein [Teredinibacter purpureus]
MKASFKKSLISLIAAGAALTSVSAFSATFTTSSMNIYNYDGAYGAGDCGWVVTGSGGSGYGGGASYVATKSCSHSNQSLSYTYHNSGNYYTVTITRSGSPYCENWGTTQVVTNVDICLD